MQERRAAGVMALTLGLGMSLACGRQSPPPIVASETVHASTEGRLPFHREAQGDGISPSSSVIPPGAQIPAGTAVSVHLQDILSSATARTNDRFKAVLDAPMVVNNQTLAERGTVVTGRVVAARSMRQWQGPGYLRLTLSSISINGELTPIRTSSAFLKGQGKRTGALSMGGQRSLREAKSGSKAPLIGSALIEEEMPAATWGIPPHEAIVGPQRRLTFRLIDPLPLHP